MSLEVEAKVRVTDRSSIERRVSELAGEPFSDVITCDIFFDTPEHTLRRSDAGLRIRLERSPDGSSSERAGITYKGPREPGPIKRREELEVGVSDGEQAAAVLEKLGYAEQMRYEKRRRSWRLDSGCRVELDEVPYLGDFVEIEGPDDAAVSAARERLGLSDEPLIRDSYIALLDAYLREHGMAERSIMFNRKAAGDQAESG